MSNVEPRFSVDQHWISISLLSVQVIIDVKPSIRIILIIITDYWSNWSDKNNTGIVDVFYIFADQISQESCVTGS